MLYTSDRHITQFQANIASSQGAVNYSEQQRRITWCKYKNWRSSEKKQLQVYQKLSYKGLVGSRWIEPANGYSTTAQLRQQYTVTINSAHG